MPRMYRQFDGRWVLPGKQSRNAELVIIPDRAAEFCDWLNEYDQRGVTSVPDVDFVPPEGIQEVEVKMPVLTTSPPCQPKQTQFKADEIIEFILDHATINQVASIHSSIGTRFAEHIKESRP